MSERRLFSCPTMRTVLPSRREGTIFCSQYTFDRDNVHLRLSHFGILSRTFLGGIGIKIGVQYDLCFCLCAL